MNAERLAETAQETVRAMNKHTPFASALVIILVLLLAFCIYENLDRTYRDHAIHIDTIKSAIAIERRLVEMHDVMKKLRVSVETLRINIQAKANEK